MKNLWFIVFFSLSSIAATAQPADAVHLKNGNVIRGVIVEQTIGESLKVRTGDGSVFVLPESDIERIERGVRAPRPAPAAPADEPSVGHGLDAEGSIAGFKGHRWRVGGGYMGSTHRFRADGEKVDGQIMYGLTNGFEIHTMWEYVDGNRMGVETGIMVLYRDITVMGVEARQWYARFPLNAKLYLDGEKGGPFLSGGVFADLLASSSISRKGLNPFVLGISAGGGWGALKVEYGISLTNDVERGGSTLKSRFSYMRLSLTL